MLGQASWTGLRVEGSSEKASWRGPTGEYLQKKAEGRRSPGEGRREKVSWRRSAGKGLPAKASGRRSPGEGQLEKASQRRPG
jgi:hypothetical protein